MGCVGVIECGYSWVRCWNVKLEFGRRLRVCGCGRRRFWIRNMWLIWGSICVIRLWCVICVLGNKRIEYFVIFVWVIWRYLFVFNVGKLSVWCWVLIVWCDILVKMLVVCLCFFFYLCIIFDCFDLFKLFFYMFFKYVCKFFKNL